MASKWNYKLLPAPTGGIDSTTAPEQLEDNQAISLVNIRIRQDRIVPDTGYVKFGQSVAGVPQGDFIFEKTDGTLELVLITTLTVYTYRSQYEKWHLVKGSFSTTTTAEAASGGTTISVADASGFSVGNLIAVFLDNSDQHQVNITAISGSSLTLSSPIPSGRSVLSGAQVIKAVQLSGNLDNHVSGVTLPSHNWFVFTNGVDTVKRYDGADCIDLPGLSNTTCTAVALYNAALFLLGTTEAGNYRGYRVRRSNQADPTDWTTGTAGFDDLLDQEDPIQTGVPLGPYLIVYRDRSVVRCEFVGAGGLNYRFDTMVRGEGALSPSAVVDINEFHLLIGHSNIYKYRGSFELEPIGDPIYYRVFSSSGYLNPARQRRCFAFYVEELDEAWFIIPSTDADNPYRMERMIVPDGVWYSRSFAHKISGFGFYLRTSSTFWSDLIGDWSAQEWDWGTRITLKASPTVHLCSAETSEIFEYDFSAGTDGGTDIQYSIETKELITPNMEGRFDHLDIGISSTGAAVHYSTNGGISWSLLGTVNLPQYGRARLYSQFPFNRVRFRISGVDRGFSLGWLGISFRVESPW